MGGMFKNPIFQMLLSKKWFWDKLDITHTTQDKQFAA
jgi:hypothetical protein